MDSLIDRLPRNTKVAPNAIVWQDAAGRICIELVGGGALLFSRWVHDNSIDSTWDLEEVL